jgi:hypothetical protein
MLPPTPISCQTAQMHLATRAALLSAISLLPTTYGSAEGSPWLRVRGRAELALTDARRQGGKTVFTGVLTDASLRYGLAGRTVRLLLQEEERNRPTALSSQTDEKGRFRLSSRACPRRCSVSLSFDGGTYYTAATYGPHEVEPAKLSVSLELELPRRLDAASARAPATLRTRAGDQGISLPVQIRLGNRLLLTTQTDGSGLARIRLPVERMGRPGRKSLVASFAGSPRFNPTTCRAETVLETAVRVELTSDAPEVHLDRSIELSGRVRDVLGPVSQAAVSIYAASRHAVSVTADRSGAFRASISAEQLGEGPVDLIAYFTPGVIWRRPSRSSALVIQVAPPKPPSPYPYAYSLLGTSLLVGLLALAHLLPRLSELMARGRFEATCPLRASQRRVDPHAWRDHRRPTSGAAPAGSRD